MDAIKEILCPPLFYTEFVVKSTMEKKGKKNLIEHFFVEVLVCIRPVQISDYNRPLEIIGANRTLVFASVTVSELKVVVDLLGRAANEIGLTPPTYLPEQSGDGASVFIFR
jgi:hypothetical protein